MPGAMPFAIAPLAEHLYLDKMVCSLYVLILEYPAVKRKPFSTVLRNFAELAAKNGRILPKESFLFNGFLYKISMDHISYHEPFGNLALHRLIIKEIL
jgi:hypothetical protein